MILIWLISPGTQLNQEFKKVLDVIFGRLDTIVPGVYGYEFLEDWMR